jgi:hypothetical protein
MLLYHGTSKARFEIGIKREGLRGNMPRHMKIDDEHMGYVFLSSNLNDAAFYSIYTVEMDNLVEKFKPVNQIVNAGTIIEIRTSGIKHDLEIDPEQTMYDEDYRREDPRMLEMYKKMCCQGQWYRYKGNIPTKYFVRVFDSPIDKQDPFIVEGFRKQAQERYATNILQIIQGVNRKT